MASGRHLDQADDVLEEAPELRRLRTLDALTEVYPDTQLVMTHRDPAEVVGSCCSLIKYVRAIYSDDVDLKGIGESFMDTFRIMIDRADAFKATHGAQAILDIQYADTVRDPIGTVRRIYDRFDEPFTPQAEEGVTYAKKIEKAESRIDWSRPAEEVHNLIRGMSPFPGAWFELELNGVTTRIKVLRSTLAAGSGAPGTILPDLTIACGGGAVRLLSVQREGKAAMDAATFLRGAVMPERAL